MAFNNFLTDSGLLTLSSLNINAQNFTFVLIPNSIAGYTSGGFDIGFSNVNVIDKFPFATNANATDVGDLTGTRPGPTGQSSSTHGYTSGGYSPSSIFLTVNVIDKFPFATGTTNATDVGDLTGTRSLAAGQSSNVSGYTSGGATPPFFSNIIDRFPFASDANATDVGDLTAGRYNAAGQSSSVSGYTSGGFDTGFSNVIERFPFATNANATDVGDLTVVRPGPTGQSSSTHGYTSGGYSPSPTPGVRSNIIDKFPFATNANATDVGDLTVGRGGAGGQSSNVSGYTSGGYYSLLTQVNVIDRFPFASDTNATDVGDLTLIRSRLAGHQW